MDAYQGRSDLEIKSNDPEERGTEKGIEDGKESIERPNHKETAAFHMQIASPLPVEQRLRARIDLFLDRYGLTPMGRAVALHWIQTIGSDRKGFFDRVRPWLLGQLNASRQRGPETECSSGLPEGVSRWQEGCPEIIPGLRSKAFWSSDDLPWVAEFERGFDDVRRELLALRGRQGFQPYRAPRGHSSPYPPAADGIGSHGNDRGDWNVFYLFLHNMDFTENREACPTTCELVKALPRHYEHSFFSALAAGTHIVKHHGPTNKKLRVHLPILTPGSGLARLRVGSEIVEAHAGRAIVFDDSFEHEAWNDDVATKETGRCEERSTLSAGPRVNLIADVWHPDLTSGEVRFLSFLQRASLRLYKRVVEQARGTGASSLTSVRPSCVQAAAAEGQGPDNRPGGGAAIREHDAGHRVQRANETNKDIADKLPSSCDRQQPGTLSQVPAMMPLRETRGDGDAPGDEAWRPTAGHEVVSGPWQQRRRSDQERGRSRELAERSGAEGDEALGGNPCAYVGVHEAPAVHAPAMDNFLEVITRARSLRPREESIFGKLDS